MAELKDGGFKTSLFGFDRDEVLAMIDSLASDNARKEAELKVRADEAQKKLDLLSQNYNDLLEKAREISSRLAAEQKKGKELHTKMDDMEDELLLAKEWNETYKVEFEKREASVKEAAEIKAGLENLKEKFEQEKQQAVTALQQQNEQLRAEMEQLRQQLTAQPAAQAQPDEQSRQLTEQLRAENARLQESLQAQRVQIEQLEQQVKTLQQQLADEKARGQDGLSAEARAEQERLQMESRKMMEDAKLRLESAEALARQAMDAHRRKMAEDAQGIAVGVAVMKDRLGNVDSRLSDARQELENCTGAIYAALSQAEKDLEDLGVQMNRLSKGETPDIPQVTRQAMEQMQTPPTPAPQPTAQEPPAPVARLSRPELKVVNARPEPPTQAEPDYKQLSQNLLEALGRMMNE